MAYSNYLSLTNQLLNRLIETELTSSNFASASSVQKAAKQCILHTVNEIYTDFPKFPWRFRTNTKVLSIGTEEYLLPGEEIDWPTGSIDWKSFRLVKDDSLGINTTPLKLISHDEWKTRYRAQDEDSGVDGRGIPRYVIRSNGPTNVTDSGGFIVSPSPDKAYTVEYDYWIEYNGMVEYYDDSKIPDRFDFVILAGALEKYYSVKENLEQASKAAADFKKGLSQMKRYLMENQTDVVDTRVNY